MCTSPVSCAVIHSYALRMDSAVERDKASPLESGKTNLMRVISELEDESGCDGEVRISRWSVPPGCYCVTQPVPRSLLGGGFFELIILKSTPFVALLLVTVRIFHFWWFLVLEAVSKVNCEPRNILFIFSKP